jgi:DNA polymerase-3 subunit delta
MQVRADQLKAHLAKAGAALKPIYTVWGDEPLLVQEAADAIRAVARAAGCTEKQIHTVAGAHFNWSGLLGASQSMSLFGDKQLIEIRIPSGKPGKDGSQALQRYCAHLSPDTVSLVLLPRLDRQQQQGAWFTALEQAGVTVRIDPIDRKALPGWISQRLAAQGQRVEAGEAGQHSLSFFADQVEGNLLSAHQEIQKLSLLHPAGELTLDQIRSAVLNVARYDVFSLGEAVWSGQVERALRMLEGLEAEGEAAVLVHWTLSDDIRTLHRVHQAVAARQPLSTALREARVWGAKERLFERLIPRLSSETLSHWLQRAHECDGVIKGLKQAEWPASAWGALRQLTLLLLQGVMGPSTQLVLSASAEG